MLEVGPKFIWDIPIIRNLGLYLTPSAMIGYTYYDVGFQIPSSALQLGGGGSGNYFDMQSASRGS